MRRAHIDTHASQFLFLVVQWYRAHARFHVRFYATAPVATRIFGIITRPKRPYNPTFLKNRILFHVESIAYSVLEKTIFTAIHVLFILAILSSVRHTVPVLFPERFKRASDLDASVYGLNSSAHQLYHLYQCFQVLR